MDLGIREVGDAADVVHVEMCDDDVANVIAAEAESLYLADRGFVLVEFWSEEMACRPHPPAGIVAVVRTMTGVDEHEAVVGLDE